MTQHHRLTEKDREEMVATCSACGPATPIAKNGKYGYVCREARREARRRYRSAHPERARRPRRGHGATSMHRLTNRDGTPDTCSVCGPVLPVVTGRGYGCPNRAKELGWKVFADAPQPQCPTCRTFLDRLGACAVCDHDDTELHLPLEARQVQRDLTRVSPWMDDGFLIQSSEILLESESAVYGWKTLGSSRPWDAPKVRPEYAALYGAGSK